MAGTIGGGKSCCAIEAEESFLCIGGILRKDEEVGLVDVGAVVDEAEVAFTYPLLDSTLFLELEVCLSFPLPDSTARALSSDDLAASSETRGVLDLSIGGAALADEPASAVLLLSTCSEERRLDFDSLASFLAAAFASFSFFLRRSSSSSIDKRMASMTMSSSRLQRERGTFVSNGAHKRMCMPYRLTLRRAASYDQPLQGDYCCQYYHAFDYCVLTIYQDY